ncbi:conjugal transfer protein TraB, partial [Klebsiella pneumoniae]
MGRINTILKRKQYLWVGIVVVGAASPIGGARYLFVGGTSGNGGAVAEQETVPGFTGVVESALED